MSDIREQKADTHCTESVQLYNSDNNKQQTTNNKQQK